MKKHFYSHLISTQDITLEIAELEVNKEERVHLLSLTEANIHSTVVSTVLDQLPNEDKKIFLSNLTTGDYRKIWEHLNSKIDNAEEKVQASIKEITRQLLKDIKKAKKLNKESKPS